MKAEDKSKESEQQIQKERLLQQNYMLSYVKQDNTIKAHYMFNGQHIRVSEPTNTRVSVLYKYLPHINFFNLIELTISFQTIANFQLISWLNAPLLQKLELKIKRNQSTLKSLVKCNFKDLKIISYEMDDFFQPISQNFDFSSISRVKMFNQPHKQKNDDSLFGLINFNRQDGSDLGLLAKLQLSEYIDRGDVIGGGQQYYRIIIQPHEIIEALVRKFGNDVYFRLPDGFGII